MNAQFADDDALIQAIQNGDPERQAALREIYNDRELRTKVSYFVKNHGGNAEDGQDVFHEGIIVLDSNLRKGKFLRETSLAGYLFSICRLVWMNRWRKNARVSLPDELPPPPEPETFTPEVSVMDDERRDLIRQVLASLGERCQRILEMWRTSHSMEEIAETMGLANEAQARKAKYRCHLNLMELLEQNPQLEQLLKSLQS